MLPDSADIYIPACIPCSIPAAETFHLSEWSKAYSITCIKGVIKLLTSYRDLSFGETRTLIPHNIWRLVAESEALGWSCRFPIQWQRKNVCSTGVSTTLSIWASWGSKSKALRTHSCFKSPPSWRLTCLTVLFSAYISLHTWFTAMKVGT